MAVSDKNFSSRLSELLARKGLNKKELSRAIGRKPGTVTPYFKGRIPRADILRAIAQTLDPGWGIGPTVAYLISGPADSVVLEDEQSPAGNQAGVGSFQSKDAENLGLKTQPQTQMGDIDSQIVEHLAISQEVLAELLRKKHGLEQPQAKDHVHPYLEQAAFFVFDQMAIVRYASPSACKLAGTTPAAAVGQSTTRNLAPEETKRPILEQAKAMCSRGFWAGETTMLTSEYDRIKCIHFQFLIRDEDGVPCMGNILIPVSDLDDIRKDLHIDPEEVMRHTKWETDLAETSNER